MKELYTIDTSGIIYNYIDSYAMWIILKTESWKYQIEYQLSVSLLDIKLISGIGKWEKTPLVHL